MDVCWHCHRLYVCLGAYPWRKPKRGGQGGQVGAGRHLAHLLDDGYLRRPHASIKVGMGPEEELLPRHGSPHGENKKSAVLINCQTECVRGKKRPAMCDAKAALVSIIEANVCD